MKIKSLAIAAALATTAGAAQAADLGHPVKAAVDYVKVCDAYGAGFFYIPGGETCLQISGYVQFTTYAGNSGDTGFGQVGPVGGSDWTRNSFWSQTEIELDFDARTNTEFGLLRSYIAIRYDTSSVSGTSVTLQRGYIQWGGLTAGRTESNFAFYTGDSGEYVFGEVFGGGDQPVNQLAYTFSFGNGVSATIALEDSTTNSRKATSFTPYSGLYGVYTYSGTGGSYYSEFTYGGNKAPDIVANLHIEQAWGKAQIMGALHYVNGANTYGYNYTDYTGYGNLYNYYDGYTQHKVSKWGYAIGAGVTFNVPTLGAGDTVSFQATYGEGAMLLVSDEFYSAGPFGVDATIDALGDIHLTKAWAIGAGFDHHFSPTVDLAVSGGYLNTSTAAYYGFEGEPSVGYGEWAVSASLNWTPAKGLLIQGTAEYASVNFNNSAKNNYEASNKDAWLLGLRVKKSF